MTLIPKNTVPKDRTEFQKNPSREAMPMPQGMPICLLNQDAKQPPYASLHQIALNLGYLIILKILDVSTLNCNKYRIVFAKLNLAVILLLTKL